MLTFDMVRFFVAEFKQMVADLLLGDVQDDTRSKTGTEAVCREILRARYPSSRFTSTRAMRQHEAANRAFRQWWLEIGRAALPPQVNPTPTPTDKVMLTPNERGFFPVDTSFVVHAFDHQCECERCNQERNTRLATFRFCGPETAPEDEAQLSLPLDIPQDSAWQPADVPASLATALASNCATGGSPGRDYAMMVSEQMDSAGREGNAEWLQRLEEAENRAAAAYQRYSGYGKPVSVPHHRRRWG